MFSPGELDGIVRDLRNPQNNGYFAKAAERIHREATGEDLPQLMALLEDNDALVREAAAWPISELAGARALPNLLGAYQRGLDDGLDNDGFTAALIDLVQVTPVPARLVLRELTNGTDSAMRENAHWLLEFCDPR